MTDSNTQQNLALDIRNLSIAFGGLKAVDNLSFSIREGEIYGLIGPNGAGKTTVFNCITRFYEADEGEIFFKNSQDEIINLNDYSVEKVIHQGLGRTFQNLELVPELTTLENVMIGSHIRYETGFVRQLFSSPKTRREEKDTIYRAEEIMEKMGLLPYRDVYCGALPYGIRKKVEIARVLMSDPVMIILDEPAAGLNETETDELCDLIRAACKEMNLTVLLIEHDMGLVMKLCDRITAISFGKHIGSGTPTEVRENEAIKEAYLGVEDDDE